MPRPPKSRNPLSRWRDEHKERQQEQAARTISEKNQENARRLIDELSSVDFIHSGLSADVLNDRRGEAVRPEICSLEWDTRALIQLLRHNTQSINMDIQPIDEKLMTLAQMLKAYISHGDVTAATTAQRALYHGIRTIRCSLPTHLPELADAFIKKNAKHLEDWITLVKFAQRYDHTQKNLKYTKKAVQEGLDRKTARLNDVTKFMENTPGLAETYQAFLNAPPPAEPADWPQIPRELHTLMVNAKLEDFGYQLRTAQCTSLEDDLTACKQHMDALFTHLTRLPSNHDSELMDKYWEAMEEPGQDPADTNVRLNKNRYIWEQIAPDFPDFGSLPDQVKEDIILATRRILEEYRNKTEKPCAKASPEQTLPPQEIHKLSIDDLCKALFDEDVLTRLNHLHNTSQD